MNQKEKQIPDDIPQMKSIKKQRKGPGNPHEKQTQDIINKTVL